MYVMQTSGVGHSYKSGGSASSGLRGVVYQLFTSYDTYIHTLEYMMFLVFATISSRMKSMEVVRIASGWHNLFG